MQSLGSEPLDNSKHEHFCQLYAQGMHRIDAFTAAGYKPSQNSHQRARALARKELVRCRINFLQAAAAEGSVVSLEWLIDEAKDVLRMAKSENQLGPAVGALKELGILCGFRVERREQTVKTSPDELTDAELLAIASRGRPLLEHAPADTAETASAILPAQDVEDAA